ncbi:MAG: hypothetical protein AAGF53_08365 [Pseudomonadota bacterium]
MKDRSMIEQIKIFLKEERGAISADWVVLTVSIVCLSCLAIATASDATFGLAERVSTSTADSPIGTSSDVIEYQHLEDK